MSPADLYAALRRTGLHHGQAFAALTRIVRKPGGSSEVEIVLPDEAAPHRSYRIHPVMLDAALQGSGRGDVCRIVGGFERGHLSASVIGDDPGVRRCRPAGPMPRRAGQVSTATVPASWAASS